MNEFQIGDIVAVSSESAASTSILKLGVGVVIDTPSIYQSVRVGNSPNRQVVWVDWFYHDEPMWCYADELVRVKRQDKFTRHAIGATHHGE